MLALGAIALIIAVLLWLMDSFIVDADVDLSMAVRVLIGISAMLIGLNVLFH